jgi:hypothetical protein
MLKKILIYKLILLVLTFSIFAASALAPWWLAPLILVSTVPYFFVLLKRTVYLIEQYSFEFNRKTNEKVK